MASRLERLVSIDAYIRAGNYPTAQKLCEMFEVQARTIYQDLRELREMFGLDIQFDRQRNGYYNSDPTKELPQLAMTNEEGLLLTLAIEFLAAQFGTSFRGALSRASEIVRSTDSERFAWLRDVIHVEDRANCDVSCNVLLALLRSTKHQQRVALTFDDGTAIRFFEQPITISYAAGHWNLVGEEVTKTGGEVDDPVESVTLCSVKLVQTVGPDGKLLKGS